MAENGSLGLRPANMQLSQCSLDAMAQLLPSRQLSFTNHTGDMFTT